MATILIVDDEPSVAKTLALVFSMRKHAAVTAPNGTVALALASKQSFDAALVDVNMPGMDGFTVCRELRAQAKANGRKLPVWMMTGAFSINSETNAANAGAVCLLRKPFDFEPLLRAIDARLRRPSPSPIEETDVTAVP